MANQDVKDRFNALKEKKDKLEKSKMEYEVRLESLKSQIVESLKTLYAEYSVNSLEEAKAKYKPVEQELIKELEDMEKQLSVYEKSVEDFDL